MPEHKQMYEGAKADGVQMSGKSTAIPLSPSSSSSKVQILRFSEQPVPHLAISPSTVCSPKPQSIVQLLNISAENKLSIVVLGGLPPLIRQMMSPNVEVQCNAVGCITNLATHEDNKAKIASSGALGPLTKLARSKDMRVQRNATGALLNMTHSSG